jgi:hypothetical protein
MLVRMRLFYLSSVSRPLIPIVLPTSSRRRPSQKHGQLRIPIAIIMSLREDAKRSVDIERYGPEHPGRVEVSPLSSFRSLIYWLEAHQLGHLQDISLDGYDDPNFDPTATLLLDESPYPEVRSAVTNTDDPEMPSSTFRAWVVGLAFDVLLSGVNQFFFFRYPFVSIDPARLRLLLKCFYFC